VQPSQIAIRSSGLSSQTLVADGIQLGRVSAAEYYQGPFGKIVPKWLAEHKHLFLAFRTVPLEASLMHRRPAGV
jgi:hypothetical protein